MARCLNDLLAEGGYKGRIFLGGTSTGGMKGRYYTITEIFRCEYKDSSQMLMAHVDILYPPEETKEKGRVVLADMLNDEVCDITKFFGLK